MHRGAVPSKFWRFASVLATQRATSDRTKYTCPRPISYMTHHAQRISLGIVRAEARAYLDALARRKSDLVRLIGVVSARS